MATVSTEQWELHQQATDHTVVVPDDGEPAFCTACEWIEGPEDRSKVVI